jgi:hypothetical protein
MSSGCFHGLFHFSGLLQCYFKLIYRLSMTEILQVFFHVLHVRGRFITNSTAHGLLESVSLSDSILQSTTYFVVVHIIEVCIFDFVIWET